MNLTGHQLLGASTSAEGSTTFTAKNPAGGVELPTAFHEATAAEIDKALQLAQTAAIPLRKLPASKRADFLEAIADEIEALGDALLERAGQETGLPAPRLAGERGRTIDQARAFAHLIRDGSWVDARIDRAQPDREPFPKPDVRSLLQGVGPCVVFGASNFPLAISVAGADTIAALGAGCPVVIKAHHGHPGTCELVASAVLAAAKKTGMPEGTFSLVQGASHETGAALVQHPRTKVVAFTGSLAGGRALANLCAARPEPIPFYGELGSTNPVFLLPGALSERGSDIAEGFIGSLTLGVGQFCTNPGLVVGLAGEQLENFKSSAAGGILGSTPATMLHAGLHSAYINGVERLANTPGLSPLAEAAGADPAQSHAAPTLFETDAATVLGDRSLQEEVFGPASTIVACADKNQLLAFAEQMDGSLTATIHGTDQDLAEHTDLVALLEEKVGRLVFNGFPTGIEVCPSMHHGGPYPASTHAHFTSIGTRTITKFTRPVCYQGFPQKALPAELQDANPMGIQRMVDGEADGATS